MSTWAVSTVKDEADVIEGAVRHMLDEVDGVIVCDNGSTDNTAAILESLVDEYDGLLVVVHDAEVAYYQSARMTRLAETAAMRYSATWIVPFDADELWVSLGSRIRDDLAACDADIVTAEVFTYLPSGIDPVDGGPFDTIRWRLRDALPLPKVAFRWTSGCVIHQGNHGVDRPCGSTTTDGLRVYHYPYRSTEQFVRKAVNGSKAYAATDLPADVGAHWRGYGEIVNRHGIEALEDVYREHFWAMSPADKGWLLDPAPFMRWRQ